MRRNRSRRCSKMFRRGRFDGFHSGFPCNTFSVARWNERAGMPGPIRSGKHIYGLPSNDRRQQADADRGNFAGWKVSFDGRPATGGIEEKEGTWHRRLWKTLLGREEKGSAWALPEIKAFMKKWACEEANFKHLCVFRRGKFRWKKPGRFGGRLAPVQSAYVGWMASDNA